MYWTHFFDFLAKLVSLLIFIATIIFMDEVIAKDQFLVIFVVSMGIGIGVWWSAFRPLSSFIYARVRLDTRLSFEQAKRASVLFSPIRNLTAWHPMREVALLPEPERIPAILSAADAVLAYHDARARQWRAAPIGARTLRGLLWVAMGGCVFGVILNVPPFSWLSEAQATVFEGKYYPILNFFVGAIPIGIAFSVLERKYGMVPVAREEQEVSNEVRDPKLTEPPQTQEPVEAHAAPVSTLEDAQRVPAFVKHGVSHPRVRHGDEFDAAGASARVCPECGAAVGQYHSLQCERERCPLCGGQARYCAHDWSAM